MNNMIRTVSVYAVVFSILIVFQSCVRGSGSEKEETASKAQDFYTVDDFSTVKKIDSHIHIRTDESGFIEQAVEDNFRLVDINVYKTTGPTAEAQRERSIRHVSAFPSDVRYATAFSTRNLESQDWPQQTIDFLKKSFAQGAIGVKVWKNIGMELRNPDSSFVMIDNPKFDPVFDFIAENKLPLLSHQGEPRDCWLPLDEMTFHKGYFRSHPEFHMYLHPEYPSYEDQINARDNMLAKHPDLKVVCVHMASLEWSVDEVAKRLDKFPNMAIDLAARIPDLQFQVMNDRQNVYDFFIKYQDRILYGTDIISRDGSDAERSDFKKRAHERWAEDWRFFVTDDVITTSKGEIKGLKLPREVVDKIYHTNAETWLPGMAK